MHNPGTLRHSAKQPRPARILKQGISKADKGVVDVVPRHAGADTIEVGNRHN